MANLLSLPNELLHAIFLMIPDIRMVVLFASIHPKIHAIWTRHDNEIIEALLKTSTPAYEHALNLAILQTTGSFDRPARLSTDVQRWAQMFKYNAATWVSIRRAYEQPDPLLKHRSMEAAACAYYLTRQLLLLFPPEQAHLRSTALQHLDHASPDDLSTYFEYCCWATDRASPCAVHDRGVPLVWALDSNGNPDLSAGRKQWEFAVSIVDVYESFFDGLPDFWQILDAWVRRQDKYDDWRSDIKARLLAIRPEHDFGRKADDTTI